MKTKDELNQEVMTSVYNKRTEIHYNEWKIDTRSGGKVKIDLQGKIKCPLLNTNISSLACSKIMDRPDWPRGIDETVCKRCNCFISMSIQRFQDKGKVK